jgi:hypothetical protein
MNTSPPILDAAARIKHLALSKFELDEGELLPTELASQDNETKSDALAFLGLPLGG